ncbi:MAG: phosphopentomutase [Solirubrobacteraceae bacterium]|nr:phosphopentomutase [Solirubrobacteraceae bacterium]
MVIDACGAGALPDAAAYGDAGANTLVHLAQAVGGLRLPTLERLGLGSILPLRGVAPAAEPALHGCLHPLGPGKDSTTGHWELMGVVPQAALPTYPDGFPPELVAVVERAAGRATLGNRPYDGLAALEDFGPRQLQSGELISYTSQDSVLQLAAHVNVMGADELYAICERVRDVMRGEHAVGRVIARPFAGAPGAFARTHGRRDFSLAPPGRSYLEELHRGGARVHAVGKVGQLFAGVGIDEDHPAPTNARALEVTGGLLGEIEAGLVFTNLVETDQVYGHRKDVAGFHAALQQIDAAVAGWLERLGPGDLLVLTADHGCDTAAAHTDHTREYAPLLAVFPGHGGRRHDGALADVGASVLRWLCGDEARGLPGTPFT